MDQISTELLTTKYEGRISDLESEISKAKRYFESTYGEMDSPQNMGTDMPDYLPIIAVIEELLGDLNGKTIVEIGTGQRGLIALTYFGLNGSNAIGIDQSWL